MRIDGKPTLREVAEVVGCTIRALSKYKLEGVDVHDVEAVRAHRRTKRTGDAARTPQRGDLHDAKLRLTNAQADRAELQAARERRELVEVAQVREDMLALGGATKALLMRLESDLPPRLEGTTAADMQLVIREAVDAILVQLSDSQGRLYK